MVEFEILEDIAIPSQINNYVVKVRLRRQLGLKISPLIAGPYCLDLVAGHVQRQQYGLNERSAREAAARFMLEHVGGIAPVLH